MEEIKNNISSECEEVEVLGEVVDVQGAQTAVLANTLKLMNGKFGGAFYVRYICDTSRGCGWLQLLIEYPTGMVQTQLLCKNVCKISNYDEDGLGEVKGISYEHKMNGEMALFKPYISDSLRNGVYDIMRVYERPNMPIPMKTLWQRIVENYSEIPTLEISVKSSLQDVYEALIERGEKFIGRDINRLGKDCVLLTKTEVEEVVAEFGYTLQEIRTEFAIRGLWLIDTNSGGYQKTKKIGGVNHRFYALRKRLQNISPIERKTLEDVEYMEIVPPTKEYLEIEQLKSKLAETTKQRDDMTQIVCERVPDLTQQEIMEKLL